MILYFGSDFVYLLSILLHTLIVCAGPGSNHSARKIVFSAKKPQIHAKKIEEKSCKIFYTILPNVCVCPAGREFSRQRAAHNSSQQVDLSKKCAKRVFYLKKNTLFLHYFNEFIERAGLCNEWVTGQR